MTSSVLDITPPQACASVADQAVQDMIAQLSHDDTTLRYYAAWWLGKFGSDPAVSRPLRETAVSMLILALTDEADRTELGGFPLRRNAARALGKFAAPQAIPDLLLCLACEDFYVREAAAQALGQIGQPQAITPLVNLLAGGVAAAQLVPGRPHLTQPYEAILESLGQLNATSAIDQIRPFLEHSLERVRFSAARALCQLTGETAAAEILIQALNSSDVQLRRSALLDLGATGYFPAATAIAAAAVENSFKLIALRGLVVAAVKRLNGAAAVHLNPDLGELFTLMDGLL